MRTKKNYLLQILLSLFLCCAQTAWAGWQIQSTPTTQQLRDIDGVAENRILAAGNAGTILQYDGAAWTAVPAITGNTVFGVWWASKNEAFAVCDKGAILHFDGSDWSFMSSGTTLRLRDIWGTSHSNVFAVGETGTILHFDGNSWAKMPSPSSLTLQSIWGTAGSDIYAVGGASASDSATGGVIIHYNGKQWAIQSEFTIPRLQDVCGVPGGAVYATGEAGTILVSSGDGHWATMASGTVETLRGIWGTSDANLYAVGDYGTVLHYDGAAWKQESSGTSQDLFGIWGASTASMYAVGKGGVILHYEDNSTDNATCPFTAAVSNNDDLLLLRAARDSRLGTLSGMCLTALFYATAPETARIVQHDPALKNKIAELVAQNRPVLQALAEGTSGQISRSSLHDMSAFLKELQAGSSRKLAIVLAGARHGLEHGWLLSILDISVE